MGNPPWLDNLSDDWISLPGSPTSPAPGPSSVTHSRRSSLHSIHSLQNTPSRIPIPARRSVEPSSSPDPKKKVTRPCHFIKRESPTPKTPRTPKTPSKLRSPVPDKTKKSPKPTPSSGRKQPPTMDGRSPLRSVSNVSSQSEQQSTVQIRPKKDKTKEGTPEWRKRLVKGEIPSGEQRDLFAPIGLESVFKPPTPRSPNSQEKAIPNMKQSGNLWDLSAAHDEDHGSSLGDDNSEKNQSMANEPKKMVASLDTGGKERHGRNSKGSQNGNLGMGQKRKDEQLAPSDSQNNPLNDTQLRSASGLEDLRNEDITPITFSRTNTVDGNGASEVIKSALKQVTNKLEKLNLAPPRERPGSRASDSMLLNQSNNLRVPTATEDDFLDVTSHSLPQDLSMGTLDYRGGEAFADLRPDPYMDGGSFQKARLSPPSFPSQRLSLFIRPSPRIRSSPPFYQKNIRLNDPPTLPRPSSAHGNMPAEDHFGLDRSEALASSGSPLKLFGNHDTFTNNKLLRRMSQFEETFDTSDEDEPVSPSEEARRKGESRVFNARQDAPGDNVARRHDRPRSRNTQTPSRINRFGEGQLDDFDFSDTSPYNPKVVDSNPLGPNLPRSSQLLSVGGRYLRRRSYRTASRDSEMHNMTRVSRSAILSETSLGSNAVRHQGSSGRQDSGLKLNLLLNSPVKDPISKRRRTIIHSNGSRRGEADFGDSPSELTDDLSLLQRSLMKHGLAYDDDGFLISQSSQRPRTPTPHQTRSSERAHSSPSRKQIHHQGNDHESPSSLLPQSVPNVIINRASEEVRKGSITTQDFLNEATKIMDIIRSKGKAPGILSSVEESDMESDPENESYEDESTREEFSRPPSREGVDMRKLREPKEPNPRILSHLKKFQEHDDLEFGVNGSVMSLHLKSDGDDAHVHHGELGNMRSDLSDQRKRKLPLQNMTEDEGFYDLLHFNTQISANTFSTRSIPIGSSQSSHAKGVLSSDIVSHLIPEQVNGLTYDRLKHQWVKEKARKSLDKRKGEDGEDDPFKDIPDLSVDELQEMMRTQSSSSPEKMQDPPEADIGNQSPSSVKSVRIRSDSHHQSKDGAPSANHSSVQSKVSPCASSYPNSGTRETSWGTDVQKSTKTSGDVEHEIKLHEGRLSKPPQHQKEHNHRARVVTISFSSPLVSHIAYSDDESPSRLRKVDANPHPDAQTAGQVLTDQAHQSKHLRLPARQTPVYESSFRRRSISRIDEGGEEDTPETQSLVPRNPETAATAGGTSNVDDSLVYSGNSRQDTSYSFYLSPLPDFTLDQIDQPIHLELSYVAQRTHPTSLRQVHGTFALATEDLVKHITEVEPFEPYWEHLRRLILRRKGLITLYRLAVFCPRLEELDVSDNDIGQLSGVPPSLRNLKIQNNCLSNLTSWGHLLNLQYLDISGNELESLDGVNSLIHLRELNASDNIIRDIDGIFDLNGLLSLNLRNNCLVTVDFNGAELTRLTDLDLSHNKLSSLRNIENLPSLSHLDVSFNQLCKFTSSSLLPTLLSLRVASNHLNHFDAGKFTALTLLYLDQNYLSSVSGLGECRGLEILSVREQIISNDQNGGFLDLDLGMVKDVRKVFLSSNKLSLQSLSPSAPLLSLQLLDLASCQLQHLPTDFALKFPNVKVLNLNFNSLPSVGELVGLNCLSRLTVAGNSISRLRRFCQVLSRIGRTNKRMACSLQKVDIRGNPLTVRFYPPPITGSGRDHVKKLRTNEEESVDDHQEYQGMFHVGDDDVIPEAEINDPYTLPPADPLADQKYVAQLDEPTRLKRRVFELMLYAGSGGSIKFLDGLEFRPYLEPGSDMDHAWTKLENLGVLKKKAITG